MEIQFVSLDNPFPPNYGGAIDIYYKIKALSRVGCNITLHAFYKDRQPSINNKYCSKIYYYKRPNSLIQMISAKPYSVKSRVSNEIVNKLIKSTQKLILICKKLNILCLMSGHVTKTGDVAGPRILEHMVDVVLQLEYLNNRQERILSPIKNRFGPTFDIGLFTLNSEGFRDVTDPASLMIDEYNPLGVGSILVPVPNGQRLFFYEIQSLVAN